MAKDSVTKEDNEIKSLGKKIKDVLDSLSGRSDEDAKRVFRELFKMLNFKPAYDEFTISFTLAGESYTYRVETLAETQPEVGESFRVYYLTAEKMNKVIRQKIVRQLVEWDEKFANFIAIIRVGNNWHIVSPVYTKETDRLEIRIYVVGEGQSHRTVSLALASLKLEKPDASAIDVRDKVNEAFKVKTLTEEFFKDYQKYYGLVKDTVLKLYRKAFEDAYRGNDLPKEIFVARAAKTFAHSLLNRLMFIYFLQRKGWLGGRRDFVRWLWKKYESTLETGEDGNPKLRNEFYSHYLRSLFFDAMNKPREEKCGLFDHLPDDVARAYEEIPYFNGGLFEHAKEEGVDVDGIVVKIPDEVIRSIIFDFLEEYNFTVSENTPLDVEIAVDPAMLGHIYESLIAQEEGARKSSGIFYTPEAEVDFMVRMAILEYLLTELYKIYGAGKIEDEFRGEIREQLIRFIWGRVDENIVPPYKEDIIELIRNVRIVDPACGSGAFLVAAFNVLGELHKKLGLELNYERKKEIIRKNIYGVDIKSWATRVAELRLWLALIEDEDELPEKTLTDLSGESTKELPILPNLKANIKTADSIVPKEIIIDGEKVILPRRLADKFRERVIHVVSKYQQKLKDVFDGLVKTPEDELKKIKEEIFRELVDKLYNESKTVQATLDLSISHKEILNKDEKIALKKLYQTFEEGKKVKLPFIWQIDFADAFAKGGFDIVVSNPPYVRHEQIYPEYLDLDEFNSLSKKERDQLKKWYKKAISESVKEAVKAEYGKEFELSGRSDLYAYFFIHSTLLLKPGGVLVYITSNSWLDVEFGVKLQEFFLRYTKLRYVFDSLYRSFEEADINTVITVLERKSVEEANILDKHIVSFVLFKKDFEEFTVDDIVEATSHHILHARKYKLFNGAVVYVYEDKENKKKPRIRHITEKDLAKLGGGKFTQNSLEKYDGEKWGGLIIRAPEIFFVILDKGDKKIVRLNDLADVKPECYTGLNDFFYIDQEIIRTYGIEDDFVVPIIRSPEQVRTIMIDPKDLDTFVFVCKLSKSMLKSSGKIGALKYIEWGEKQVTRKKQKTDAGIPWPMVSSVKNRKPGWWAIPDKDIKPARLFMLYRINDRFINPVLVREISCDRAFHRVFPKKSDHNYVSC
ncbi:Eco57I restriction-modification methylase domain-containing protein [Archaeoglobus sp.]